MFQNIVDETSGDSQNHVFPIRMPKRFLKNPDLDNAILERNDFWKSMLEESILELSTLEKQVLVSRQQVQVRVSHPNPDLETPEKPSNQNCQLFHVNSSRKSSIFWTFHK